MLSIRLMSVMLLSITLQGCSFALNDVFSSASQAALSEETEVDVVRLKTSYKFTDRLKPGAGVKSTVPIKAASSSGWRVVEH